MGKLNYAAVSSAPRQNSKEKETSFRNLRDANWNLLKQRKTEGIKAGQTVSKDLVKTTPLCFCVSVLI